MADEEHYLEVWRYDGVLGVFNEATIVGGWLPATPDSWVDVTELLAGDITFEASEQLHGLRASITIDNGGRLQWDEDRPIAFVHQHYDGVSTSARALLMWGYLSGEGEQVLGAGLRVLERRTVSYADRWARRPTPSKAFGRPNLMLAATFDQSRSVLPLALPAEEVPNGEYVSQAIVDGTMGKDNNSDTVVVSEKIAELAPAYELGNTVYDIPGTGWRPVPRVVRLYAGRTSHTIGAGGQPVFIEITCHAQHILWGSFDDRAAVPAFYEQDVGPIYPAQLENDFIRTAFDPGGRNPAGYLFRCRLKNQASFPHPENGPYVQWNTSSAWYNLPAKLVFYIRSGVTNPLAADYSSGRTIHATFKPSAPDENTADVLDIVLTDDWVRHEMTLDSMGRYGGVMMRFGAKSNGVNGADLVFELDDLRVSVGYNDREHAKWCDSARYSIAFDDGIGHERWINLYNDTFLPDEWTIPPEGSLIIADDGTIFTGSFQPGERQVVSLRPRTVDFWFGPLSAARLKTGHSTNPDRTEYDTVVNVQEVIEEFLFSGINWTMGANPQALVRMNPVSTGALATEDYPRLGISTLDAFGSSPWTYDLGAYNPPTLMYDLTQTGLKATVTNANEYEYGGTIQIDDELITYVVNDDGVLTLSQRGYNPLGAPFGFGHPNGPIAHATGAAVTPWRNGAAQTGNLLQYVSIRRRTGLAPILDGKLLYSNDPAPPSPMPDYERTAGGYWKVFGRFSNNNQNTVTVWNQSGASYVEARWLVVVIAWQGQYRGVAQRAKFNEAIARQYLPYGGNGGSYQGVIATSLGYMVGHFLVNHAQVPPAKYVAPEGDTDPILDSISFAPTTVTQIIDSAAKAAGFYVLADGYGYVRMTPRPASPYFRAPAVSKTWSFDDLRAWPTVQWRSARQVSQVRVVAREYAQQRIHVIRYPEIAGVLGTRYEAKDVVVASPAMALDYARALYRQLNAQRTPPVEVGYVAGLWIGDRHVVNLPEVDPSGQTVGINCQVTSFKIVVSRGPQGSRRWRTTISLEEITL